MATAKLDSLAAPRGGAQPPWRGRAGADTARHATHTDPAWFTDYGAPAHAASPSDQADGLRRLFNAQRPRFIAVVANAEMAFSGLMLERLACACSAAGRHTLVVDASAAAPSPRELVAVELAAGIESLAPGLDYLAARGLPMRYVDTRGSCASFLQALADAAPQADAVIVHAETSELGRLFTGRAVRPLLLAADHPASVTSAYAGLKQLAQRHRLMAFDLLLAAMPESVRVSRIAEQLALAADRFVGAALHDWACIDLTDEGGTPPALARLAHGLLHLRDDAPGSELMALPAWAAAPGVAARSV